MTRSFTPVLLPLVAALVSAPLWAADECKVEYGYHTLGPTGARTDHEKTVNFDLGERKQIDRSRLNYVQNKKSQKVRVKLKGDNIPDKDFELGLNQRNPLVLFYATAAELDWLECKPDSPDQFVQAMKLAGKTAGDVAKGLKDVLGLTGRQAAEAMKVAGYSAAQVTAGLQSAFGASAEQIAQWLKAAGYTAAQMFSGMTQGLGKGAEFVGRIVMLNFNYTVGEWVEFFRQVGAAGNAIVWLLMNAGEVGPVIAKALKSDLDAKAADAALWLKGAFNASADQLAAWLRGAGYTLEQVARALDDLNYEPGMTIRALHQAFGATADQVAELIRRKAIELGTCSATDCELVARRLMDVFNDAGAVLGALRRQFDLNVQAAHKLATETLRLSGNAVKVALETAGYTAEQIAQVLGKGGEVIAGGVAAGAGAVQRGAEGAVASTMRIEYITLGGDGVRECDRYPADRIYDPVPLPPGASNHRITLLGSRSLAAATATTDWPTGASAVIEQRGPCFLVVRVSVPPSARPGTAGRAVVMAGTQPGPGIRWEIGPVPVPPRAPAMVENRPVTISPGRINPATGREGVR